MAVATFDALRPDSYEHALAAHSLEHLELLRLAAVHRAARCLSFTPISSAHAQQLPEHDVRFAWIVERQRLGQFRRSPQQHQAIVQRLRTLLVLQVADKNLTLAARNVVNVALATSDSLNTYDVLRPDKLVFTKSAFEQIEARLIQE